MSEDQMLDVEEALMWLKKYEPILEFINGEWQIAIYAPIRTHATGNDLRFLLDQFIRKIVRERNRGKNESAN